MKTIYLNEQEYNLKINGKSKDNFIINLASKNFEAKILKIESNNTSPADSAKVASATTAGRLRITSKIIYIKINEFLYKAKIEQDQINQTNIYIFNFNKTFIIKTESKQKFIPAISKNISSKMYNEENKFENKLRSPLCGKVIKINVKPNQHIKKDQPLLIIESMKMENEIRAANEAFIKTISIFEEDLVQQNQILIIFEEKKGEKNARSKNKNE